MNGGTLTVTFDKNLKAIGADELKWYLLVKGAGTIHGGDPNANQSPGWTSVSGRTLTMGLGTPARAGETVTLTYDGKVLKGTDNKRAPRFRDLAVRNNTAGAAGPSPVRGAVLLETLEVEFDGALDTASLPAGSAFEVTATDPRSYDVRAIAGTGTAAVDGSTVTVTLAERGYGRRSAATVSYTKPATNPLKGAGTGKPAVLSFDRFAVQTKEEGVAPLLEDGSERGRADGHRPGQVQRWCWRSTSRWTRPPRRRPGTSR